jgi:ketosteroid isomerase-like protein
MFRPAILFALALSACASNVQVADTTAVAPSPTVAVPTELATQNPGLLRAWQGTDPAALHAYYADNAVVVTPDGRFTGWNEIQTGWIAPFLPNMSNFVGTPTSFTRDGNDIIEYGRYSFRANMNGTMQNMRGGYSHRWQKQADGTWKIVGANITQDAS